MSETEGLFVCWTTLPSREQAQSLARDFVAAGLSACCQIDGPIESIYRWEGKVASETEYRLWLKCPAPLVKRLEGRVLEAHPYQNPQWICLPAEIVAEKYLKWANETTNLRDFS